MGHCGLYLQLLEQDSMHVSIEISKIKAFRKEGYCFEGKTGGRFEWLFIEVGYMANDGGNKGRNNMCVLVAGVTQEHLWRGGSASLPQGDAHRALIRPAAAHVVTGG